MLAASSWRQVNVGDFMWITIFRRLWQNFYIGDLLRMLLLDSYTQENVGDENGKNRHQRLKVGTNTFRLHNPSVTDRYQHRGKPELDDPCLCGNYSVYNLKWACCRQKSHFSSCDVLCCMTTAAWQRPRLCMTTLCIYPLSVNFEIFLHRVDVLQFTLKCYES